MAKKLLIVHGYSDGSTSFTDLGEFFVAQGAYTRENLFYLDYSSMDDQASFQDFADKLDSDHRTRLDAERIDVACHSTGSLVVRAWLALHAERARSRKKWDPKYDEPCPVDRLLCFAPANFGSDLAPLGQSFLGKFRSTFFNSHSHGSDFMESGKQVLQGLEPASPTQWDLSVKYDLHGPSTYFSEERPAEQRCYPFVLAAGASYTGVETKVVKERALAGTDGTVRISGTSLNTRGCSIDFRDTETSLVWWAWKPDELKEEYRKFDHIPFAVCAGFNHGSIIAPTTPGFLGTNGPGTLALEALRTVADVPSFRAMADRFEQATEANYEAMEDKYKGRYQQFFFRVRDDVDELVDDFYLDFHVLDRNGKPHAKLTERFDKEIATSWYRHSARPSHRVLMLNCSKLGEFGDALGKVDAKLALEISGVSALPDVKYQGGVFIAYDPKAKPVPGTPSLLYPNTTTLIDVILNRQETDKLLVLKDQALGPVKASQPPPPRPVTGRAAIAKGR